MTRNFYVTTFGNAIPTMEPTAASRDTARKRSASAVKGVATRRSNDNANTAEAMVRSGEYELVVHSDGSRSIEPKGARTPAARAQVMPQPAGHYSREAERQREEPLPSAPEKSVVPSPVVKDPGFVW